MDLLTYTLSSHLLEPAHSRNIWNVAYAGVKVTFRDADSRGHQ